MAKYRMKEMNDLNGTGERKCYPQMVIVRQAELKELAQQISGGSTFTVGDIMGVVGALEKHIARYLADGYSVKINGLGNFTASLQFRKGFEPEKADESSKHNARSITVGNIRFRPAKEFIQEVSDNFHPVRSSRKSRHSSSAYTPEQRLALAIGFLKSAPYLTVNDYCRLTGLLRTSAATELRRWASLPDSGITSSGLGSHKVYVSQSS